MDLADFPQVHTSGYSVIPKSTPGEWRLIVDMSHPEGASINDGIKPLSPLQYVSVEDVAKLVQSLGRNTLLAKVDVTAIYQCIQMIGGS